ncbi:MAG: FtsX-like permease family protein [Acidimicrobiia bacterium]|nr:FtsX-like permease family protein [Acidimicrobiia bacterium]
MFLLRLTLKNIAARKFLFLGTALSVVLGVAFVVGVFIVTDSLRATFDDIADDIAGSIDLRVRSEIEFGDRLNAPEVDPALADEIAGIDGVAAVTGGVAAWNVVIIDSDGEPLQSLGPPQFGVSWSDEEALTELFLAEGRPPAGPDEFATNSGTAEFADLRIGETYRVSLPEGTRAFELVGTVNWADPDEDQSQGVQFTVFDLATATELLNGGGGWDEILVDVDREADIAAVAVALRQALPPGLEVLTVEEVAEEQSAEFDTFITIFQNILLAFAVITLVVSAFLVNNVFSIVIGQRIRELGLLRVVGATGVQIRRSVLGEAATVGVIATVLGLGGGIGVSAALKAIFGALGGELPIDPLLVTGRTVGVAIAVGVGITVLAALSPALKARRITPVEALREDARLSSPVVARRPVAGAAALLAGVVLLVLGLAGDWPTLIPLALLAAVLANWGGKRLAWWAGRLAVTAVGLALLLTTVFADLDTTHLLVALSVGVLTVFVGINMTSPLFARPMARALGAPLARIDGIPGHLARQNAARSPRRTSSTAAALMIGLALVVTVSVVADSLKSSFAKVLDEQINADWFVCIGNCADQFSGFSPNLGEELEALPETQSVATYRFLNEAFRTTSDGSTHGLLAVSTAELDAHIDTDPVAGSVNDLPPGGLLAHVDQAEAYGLSVGDTLDVEVLGGEEVTWTIAGIYSDDAVAGSWVVSRTTWDDHFDVNVDQFLSVVSANGVSEEATEAAIIETAAEYPQVTVRSRDDFRDLQSDQIDQALIVVNVFLGLSLVIAVLGIVATLALSVVERTRELGLLRAVGMTRGQMRRMVCWEGLVVAIFGGILGTVLGVAFGVLAADIIPDSVVSTLSIPGGQIVLYLVIAALAGLASGILPAIWAGRLKVLEAIGYE